MMGKNKGNIFPFFTQFSSSPLFHSSSLSIFHHSNIPVFSSVISVPSVAKNKKG